MRPESPSIRGTRIRAEDQAYWIPPQVRAITQEVVAAMTSAFPLNYPSYERCKGKWGGSETHIQSILRNFSLIVPGGIRRFRNIRTRIEASPAIGILRSSIHIPYKLQTLVEKEGTLAEQPSPMATFGERTTDNGADPARYGVCPMKISSVYVGVVFMMLT